MASKRYKIAESNTWLGGDRTKGNGFTLKTGKIYVGYSKEILHSQGSVLIVHS